MMQSVNVQSFSMPEAVKAYFRQTGSIGGKKRAALYSKAQLQAWGKLGGRPRKDVVGKHAARKGAK
jgi:hypothetical protein